MSQYPPRHVCIIGALIIAAGVDSVIGMIANLLGGSLNLNLGFVGIPIGYGILIGRASSRKWAILLSAAGALLISGFGGWALFDQFHGAETLAYLDHTYSVTASLIALASCIYVFVILVFKTHDGWFDSTVKACALSNSLAWAVALISAILISLNHTAVWCAEETKAQIFPIRVNVTPYDSDSGEALKSLSYHSDALTVRSDSQPYFPKLTVSVIASTDGMQLEFRGVATRPVEVMIQSDGYRDTRVTFDKDTQDEIKLAMSPIAIKKVSE